MGVGHLGVLVVEAAVGAAGLEVRVDGVKVFHILNQTESIQGQVVRFHAGLHLVTLDERSGAVMRSQTFLTWQPESSRQVAQALRDAGEGRLLLLVGLPEFTMYLGHKVTRQLASFGSVFAERLAKDEAWCMAAWKGKGVAGEGLTIIPHSHGSPSRQASPVSLRLIIPRRRRQRCTWHAAPGMEEHATFCRTYDGYGAFCSCHEPPWSPRHASPVPYAAQEVIPVAVVTARRLSRVVRQLGQLWASPGGLDTPVTIFVDGHSPEARSLAALLRVPLVEHQNPATPGTSQRVNEHVRFTLEKVFQLHPEADLAIILEDDLVLAADFIPYFQQTAALLKSDPYLFFVNAFNYNSYPHTAQDPRRLYRAHGIPGYGWMITRKAAAEMLAGWVPLNQTGASWDWWVRARLMGARDMLIPEVPRTRHMGGGGVHISGFDQVLFSSQPINTLANVTLDVDSASEAEYEARLLQDLQEAEVVPLTRHPCQVTPVPTHKTNKTYVIYIYQPDENRRHRAYEIVATCLGINDRDIHENLRMMITFPFFGNQVYLVACPVSPYCRPGRRKVIYHPKEEDYQYALENPIMKPALKVSYALRIPPQDPQQEFALENRYIVNYTAGGSAPPPTEDALRR
ncbi:protein O-linked-mannose beta-1,2-N-acetylglucosaminyltransferase 1-like [Portunus trituberculatus]|uniref:protein O-linked-mannose beta-1,2-N-acetylglucosaminyltransferase 1-like n=1 Tax=Portunus trituberculatus TaxID=210409 RepID=UPI001E1CBCAE|nr:protein O-linked-mannose beta-1,2-N-acetylglucosaminyltransferase 1-like [Portunus trituberculatus]XP_045116728.1 protein O-linked-mannose beta-1,2-N-acetylglucosaminyltransferase 1-like [Portunus trituberculatus]